jgi:hypothetical protein
MGKGICCWYAVPVSNEKKPLHCSVPEAKKRGFALYQ